MIHHNRVMRNVTITLEEDVVRWARIRAAELNTSVSRLVGVMLRDRMKAEEDYNVAMSQYLSQTPKLLRQPGDDYPSREALHDRD